MNTETTIDEDSKQKLGSYLSLLELHRGEPLEAYDKTAGVYDDFATVWDSYIADGAMKYYNSLLQELISDGDHVLDAGAGTGERTLAILGNSNPGKIVSLDASEAMLEIAKRKITDTRVEFKSGDITHLPFEDNTFDVVSCSWVVEILEEPMQALEEFVRVIKPDGIIIYAFCSLPNGPVGSILNWVIDKVCSSKSPLTHLLPEEEQPFHDCSYSSLKRFSGGLTTVATVGKCCSFSKDAVPCRFAITSPPQTHDEI